MKRICILMGLITSYATLFGQTNTFPASGNTGIGTTTPSQKLTVSGNINIESSTLGRYLGFGTSSSDEYNTIGSLYSSAAFTISHGLKPHSSQPKLVYSFPAMSRNAIMIGGFSENGIKFYTKEVTAESVGDTFNDNPRMIIKNDGKVGIGTVQPASALHIRNDLSGSQENWVLRLQNDNNEYSGMPTTGILFASGDQHSEKAGIIFRRTGSYGTGNMYILNNNLADSSPPLISDNTVMTFVAGGNVGIGTLIPNEKLTVNGKIRAKEIKVENTNWPDFVFAKSYLLPTLKETETHIKEKGHLPGIPTAAEVKVNGIDLGDMNAKLLQKIEELTLHMIRQEKEILKLKQKLKNIK